MLPMGVSIMKYPNVSPFLLIKWMKIFCSGGRKAGKVVVGVTVVGNYIVPFYKDFIKTLFGTTTTTTWRYFPELK